MTGMARPTSMLGQILAEAHEPRPPVKLGSPKRAVLYCDHGLHKWVPIAEVRGFDLMGTRLPWNRRAHDINHPGRETWIGCVRCRKIRCIDFDLLNCSLRHRIPKI